MKLARLHFAHSSPGRGVTTPTRLYVKSGWRRLPGGVKGLAHVRRRHHRNLPRAARGIDAEVDLSAWASAGVGWLAREAGSDAEMLRTFNCGSGLIVVADSAKRMDVIAAFTEGANAPSPSGLSCPARGRIHCPGPFKAHEREAQVAVLISDAGAICRR
jgi:phosphoribosylaminoimidazole (AIR) synthetase